MASSLSFLPTSSSPALVTSGRDQAAAGAQGNRSGASVGRRSRAAALARGGAPAELAAFFHAEVARLAPLVVLAVVVAARVQAQISAGRAHVAQVHGRDLRRRL